MKNSSGNRAVAAHRLLVDVHALRFQLALNGLRVVAVEGDARHAAGLVFAARRHQRQRRAALGRRDFDPPFALPERHVGRQLEAQLLRVEVDRSVLVGYRDHHPAHVSYARHVMLLLFGSFECGAPSPPYAAAGSAPTFSCVPRCLKASVSGRPCQSFTAAIRVFGS